MILSVGFFVIGLMSLIKGANWLVDGAASLAKKIGVSAIVIGLTVVAFGTSMPEFIVNLFASFQGNTDIAIGNIIGSNTLNILIILGISAMIFPLSVKKGTVWKEIPFALLAVLLVLLMANDANIDGVSFSSLTRIDGLILIAFFIIFLYYVFGICKVEDEQGADVKIFSKLKSVFLIIAGLTGLIFGGKLIVDAAIDIARALKVSESLIGLTIVAMGTSLPELAASVVAVRKKNSDIAVGNVVGSNIFNVFWVLGVSAVIRPLPLSPAFNFDIWISIVATLLLFIFMFLGKRHLLEGWQGIVFIAAYVIYVTYLIMRG